MQKQYIISYNKQSIQLLIKKNKLSKNYKLTFDKKNLRGLVSIPKYVAFKNGLEFANENVKWLYEEINKILPLVLIKHNTSLLIMGKKILTTIFSMTLKRIKNIQRYILKVISK